MEQLDYEQIVVEYKDLVESMAFVALTKMKKPSPHSFEDLCQEGYIVCVEWVQRWFHPDRGASLKTFITGGLRNHFADLVRESFRDKSIANGMDENAEEGEGDPVAEAGTKKSDFDPMEIVSFRETIRLLSKEEIQYITVLLTPEEGGKRRNLNREQVRKALKISEAREKQLRDSILDKLTGQVMK